MVSAQPTDGAANMEGIPVISENEDMLETNNKYEPDANMIVLTASNEQFCSSFSASQNLEYLMK